MVTQKEVNEAIDTLKKARKQKDAAGGTETQEILYKENFI
jgi:hypothetical protein